MAQESFGPDQSQRPEAPTESSLEAPDDTTRNVLTITTGEELQAVLDQHGIPHRTWAGPKTADNLLKELLAGDSLLALDEQGSLRRVTSVAWIDVYSDGPDGQRYRLVEDRQVFKNQFDDQGQPVVRRRPDLLASISEKVVVGGPTPESPTEGARRGLKEELQAVDPGHLTLIRTEQLEESARSYPGLTTQSTNTFFRVEIPFTVGPIVEDQSDKQTYFVWHQET